MSTAPPAPAPRSLYADRLEQHIRRVLAEAPPLAPGQRARLASLLHPATPAIAAPGPAHDSGSRLPAGATRPHHITRKDLT